MGSAGSCMGHFYLKDSFMTKVNSEVSFIVAYGPATNCSECDELAKKHVLPDPHTPVCGSPAMKCVYSSP